MGSFTTALRRVPCRSRGTEMDAAIATATIGLRGLQAGPRQGSNQDEGRRP